MKYLRHYVAGLILFAVMVGLLIPVYQGFQEGYEFEMDVNAQYEGYNNTMEALQGLNIVNGFNSFIDGITSLVNPASTTDLIGALKSTGLGALQGIWGVVTFPHDILTIIGVALRIPPIITTGLEVIILLYISFILISIKLGWEV